MTVANGYGRRASGGTAGESVSRGAGTVTGRTNNTGSVTGSRAGGSSGSGSSGAAAATGSGGSGSAAGKGGAPLPGTPGGPATPGPGSGGPKSEILLGSFGAESDVLAGLGPAPPAIRAWSAYINAKGGINGHHVRVILGDDNADPARTLQIVRQMVEHTRS